MCKPSLEGQRGLSTSRTYGSEMTGGEERRIFLVRSGHVLNIMFVIQHFGLVTPSSPIPFEAPAATFTLIWEVLVPLRRRSR